MVVYIIIALIFFIFKNKKNIFIQLGCIVLLFLLGAFRAYTVGTDTGNTQLIYEGKYGLVIKKGEIGLSLLTNYLMDHNYSMRWELIITQAIFIGLLFLFCYKKTTKPLLVMLLFILCGYIYMSYNITRQMLAFSIVLWAYYNRTENQRVIYFFLIVALATLFHTSAIIALLIFFYDKLRLPQKTTITILIVSFIIPQLYQTNNILEFFTDRISLWSRFSYYIGLEHRETFSFNRLLMNLFFIYILIRYNVQVRDNIFFKTIVIGIIILNLFPVSPIITRMGLYFTAIQPIFLYYFIKFGKVEDRVMTSVYVVAIYANFLLSNNGGIVPYDFGGF